MFSYPPRLRQAANAGLPDWKSAVPQPEPGAFFLCGRRSGRKGGFYPFTRLFPDTRKSGGGSNKH